MEAVLGARPAWYPLPPHWRAQALQNAGSVLLETAGGLGEDHTSLLFTTPEKLLRANSAEELDLLLQELETAAREGLYAAGCLHYEAGYVLHGMAHTPQPLAAFGLYREPLRFDHHTGRVSGADASPNGQRFALSSGPLLTAPEIQITRETYDENFASVQALLIAGDTYQVNLTTRVEAGLLGSPLALYEALIEAQPVDFAAIVNFDSGLTLSFSPELFLRVDGRQISTRPMKGTATRGGDSVSDHERREWLAQDEKNRAEHVMIVDLLRNDIGRICEAGSVRTDDLFRIETYPTLFQMTSRVSGYLRADVGASGILRALFPSGSITGAPKRRTMEIIRGLESAPRGVYTGAIGFSAPGGSMCFSVPIRTLTIRDERVSMGVGGGLVADSTAGAEYAECLLKASFLNTAAEGPQLIETLLWDGTQYTLLPLHFARLTRSAAALGFACDSRTVRRALEAVAAQLRAPSRVRLLLAADGAVSTATAALDRTSESLSVRIAARRLLSTDAWLQHKTTRRTLYDREFARARDDGFDEVLFLNERDEFAEAAISTLFVQIEGELLTPARTCGVLPGVLRQSLLEAGKCREAILRLDDIATAKAVYLGNSVRGLREIRTLRFE